MGMYYALFFFVCVELFNNYPAKSRGISPDT